MVLDVVFRNEIDAVAQVWDKYAWVQNQLHHIHDISVESQATLLGILNEEMQVQQFDCCFD